MRSLIYSSILISFLSASFVTAAATKPRDVSGWNKVSWGMTVEQIQYVLGKDVKNRNIKHDEKDGVYSKLELKGIVIGDGKFRASFWMDDVTNKLERIVFVPEAEPDTYEWAETFIILENHLVEKYGDPDFQETSNDNGTYAQRKWSFPSTLIELSYLKLQEAELLLLVFSEESAAMN